MKRRPGIGACALLTCLLAGCGGGGAESFLDAQAMAQLRAVVSKEQPRLPDGFTIRPEQAWQMPFGQADENCRAVLAPPGGKAPGQALTAQAAVSYHGEGLGEQAGVGLAKYAAGEAEDHLDELAEALRKCHAVRSSSGTDLRPHELPIEKAVREAADDAVGARFSGRLNGYPYELDLVLARVGDTLVSVVHTGMNDVDAERTRKVVEAALSMVSA